MLRGLLRSRRRQRAGGVSWLSSLLGLVLAVAAVVWLPLPPLTVRVHPDRPASAGLPWLSTRDGKIVDARGRTVLLRGFNDGTLLQVGGQPASPPLTPADATLMQAEGFDVVRLPISWSLLEPAPGRFSQAYLRRIAQVVSLCARHDLYVVLDMHTEDFGVGFGGSGAPKWLSVPVVPDLKLPFLTPDWQRHLSPAVNAALTYFWLYPDWQKLYWEAWTQVVREFRNDPAVAGYDLYNEPHPLPVPPAIFETRALWPFYAQGITRLAKVDPNHLFIVEGDLFSDLPTAIRPLAAKDLVYSTHLYAGSLLPPNFNGNPAPLRAELEQGLREAGQLPAAYWAGELGIDKDLPMAAGWAGDEISLANRFLTGWAWWQWNDPDDWGVEQGDRPPDMSWLQVLAQPFIRAAPGRLSQLRYQTSSKVLTATVTGAGSDRTLLVAWPSSAGAPEVLSSCSPPEEGYRAASGTLSLRITTPRCKVRIRG
ncbi:MAG: glycoside hydrolase family 5 protein [Candidatus Dormibacteria bacterium]